MDIKFNDLNNDNDDIPDENIIINSLKRNIKKHSSKRS